jgi:NTP pyrophosphatase (non-canonical NTP hydrolase)
MRLVPDNAITIQEAQEEIFAWAKEKGWCDREVPIPEQIALVHSEMSEALESWRNGESLYFFKDGKPEGVGSEYADALIRLLHYMSLLGLNMEEIYRQKQDYNKTRPHRHGGKIA